MGAFSLGISFNQDQLYQSFDNDQCTGTSNKTDGHWKYDPDTNILTLTSNDDIDPKLVLFTISKLNARTLVLHRTNLPKGREDTFGTVYRKLVSPKIGEQQERQSER